MKSHDEAGRGGGESRLVQYRVMAEHRLHFSRLFFHLIAFNLSLTLAILAILPAGSLGWMAASCLSGLVLLGTAGISSRLLRQERRYAAAMAAIEALQDGFIAVEDASSWGARRITVLALGGAGLLLLAGSMLAHQ